MNFSILDRRYLSLHSDQSMECSTEKWDSISGKGKTFLSGSGVYSAPNTVRTGAVSRAVTQQRREADHLPPSSAKVKNDGAMPQLPHNS
jgi:hypothetical protein